MEFELIERIRSRARTRADVVLGIGDDAALTRVPPGCELVSCVDTLNAGVHFPRQTRPADIGWKALAVNLSDLAAMGALPAWCLLSLSLPEPDRVWLDAFLDGLLELARAHDLTLIGGDTTRGPLSIGVSAFGFVPEGTALLRSGARIGDDVWVTGSLGDAAAALALLQGGAMPDAELRARLDRPTPRVAAGIALRGTASACIDVSDGVLADLGHVVHASKVAAVLDASLLPASPALRRASGSDARLRWQASGGDDYELCFTASPADREQVAACLRDTDTTVTRIGSITSGNGVELRDADGVSIPLAATGWNHFGADTTGRHE